MLKLAHYSVKEFLISDHDATTDDPTYEQLAHDEIVQTSLAYLLRFNRPYSITRHNLKSFPLVEYAAQY